MLCLILVKTAAGGFTTGVVVALAAAAAAAAALVVREIFSLADIIVKMVRPMGWFEPFYVMG